MDVILKPVLVPLAICLCKRSIDWWRARRWADDAWEALDIVGRNYVPMRGASLTRTKAPPVWSICYGNPRALKVSAHDVDPAHRAHEGCLSIESGSPSWGRRTVQYLLSEERSVQRVELSDDGNLIHVTPEEAPFNKHVLRRAKGVLKLN